jgi:hypothetical protein
MERWNTAWSSRVSPEMLNSSNLISDEGKEETSMSERLWLIIWLGKRERERERGKEDRLDRRIGVLENLLHRARDLLPDAIARNAGGKEND